MLRHYDSTGLLQPQHVDEKTGYRYYSEDQFQSAIEIIRLKRYGFSLEEIKRLIENQDQDFFKQQLRIKIDATDHDLSEKRSIIDEMEQLIGETLQMNSTFDQPYSIYSGRQPEQNIIRWRSFTSESDMDPMFQKLYDIAEKNGFYPINTAGVFFHGEDYDNENAVCELFFPIRNTKPRIKNTGDSIQTIVIPAHDIITTLHCGSYETIGSAWHAIETWMQTHDYVSTTAPYELYLRSSESTVPESDYVTQICFPATCYI